MTALAKPALGKTAVDAEFGTTLRRITAVAGSGANAAIVPMYTTISAWNADESLLILYDVGGGGHQLYDGKSYQLLHPLDINPADVEQVYWDTSDPDLLYYVDGQQFTATTSPAARKIGCTTSAACAQARRPPTAAIPCSPPGTRIGWA